MKDSGLVINEFDTHQIHNYKRLSNRVAFLFWYFHRRIKMIVSMIALIVGTISLSISAYSIGYKHGKLDK